MPIKTPNLLLEAFLDGDAYWALADSRRFTTIDSHMWRLAEIIGDGVIEGWNIVPTTFPNVTITKGSGLVKGYYINSFDDQDFELSANGTFYFYAQRRVGVIGTVGPRSDVASISYVDAGPPSTPVLSSIVSPTPFSIIISWTPITDVDLDLYEIERRDGGTAGFALIADTTNINFTDSVEEDTLFEYRIYAVDESGNRSGSFASGSITTSISTILPPNPINVSMPISEAAVNILWERPPNVDFDKINRWEITHVKLNSDDSEIESTRTVRIVNKELYNDRIDSLLLGEKYRVTLQTVDTHERKSEGVIQTVIPQPNPGPRDPQGIAYSVIDAEEGVRVNASWIDGDTPYDSSISRRFKIYVTVGDNPESEGINVPIGHTSDEISLIPFDNFTRYEIIPENTLTTIRLTAVDFGEFESFGNYVRFVTDSFTLPKRLVGMETEFDIDSAEIRTNWINQNDTFDIRIVILDDDLNDAYIADVTTVDERVGLATRYVLQNAQLNHKYTVSITPFSEAGLSGPNSTTVTLTTVPDLPLPIPPDNIETSPGDRQIILTWDAPASSGFSRSFRIYKKEGRVGFDSSDWVLLDTLLITQQTFTDFGLTNGDIYSYYITAVDVYNRESLHLPDTINLNFAEDIPVGAGILTEPDNVQLSLDAGNNIIVTWDSLMEEFDSFTIYRSTNNLHNWTSIATVDKNTLEYTDVQLPLIDGTVFNYTVDKAVNDVDMIIQASNEAPEETIFIGSVVAGSSSFNPVDISDRRDIAGLLDPMTEYTNTYLLPHRHREIESSDPDRIILDQELVVDDWTTDDGRIFTTSEIIFGGTSYVVKVNGRFPTVFFSVIEGSRQIVFSEPIADVDPATGNIINIPEIEMRIFGLEEVQGILEESRFDKIHARQVQFGSLNKAQLPDIDHEGRIREAMIPDRFLLERFNNNTFIIPQTNTDPENTLGDGTTFYATVESDGLIEEVIDFDLEDDGDRVGFQKPSFAVDTVLNLKQNEFNITLEDGQDIASRYRFDMSKFYYVNDGDLNLFTLSSTVEKISTISSTRTMVHIAGVSDDGLLYVVDSDTGNNKIYTVDPATGRVLDTTATGEDIDALAFNNSNGLFYGARNSGLDIVSYNLSTNVFTALQTNTTDTKAIAYDNVNNIMYAVWNSGVGGTKLATVNITTGSLTSVGIPTVETLTTGLTYYQPSDEMYLSTSDGKIAKVNRSTGADTLVVDPFIDGNATGIESASGNSWNDNPATVNLGDFRSLSGDIYLRFPVSIPDNGTLSLSQIFFTAFGSGQSSGNNVNLNIAALDPSTYNDAVNLSSSVITTLDTLPTTVDWSPDSWLEDESISVDVTSIVQSFIDDNDYSLGRHIIFRITTTATTTANNFRVTYGFGDTNTAPFLFTSHVLDVAEVDSDTGGFQSNKSYNFKFEFADATPTRWVRITTQDTPIKPNPVIDLRKRLRFKILTNRSFYLTFGIREIDAPALETGSNGGTSGAIEWIGANELITEDDNSAPKGILIQSNSDWQNVDVDLQLVGAISFNNGNGILARGLGTLEHLAITINPEDVGSFNIFIDKIEQVDDVLVAGTSQGIQISRDFGITWTVSRLTSTPVHKFFRATNNAFLWAITADEVLLAVDPAFWFSVSGTTGVQYIRDIVEDSDGNMYVSTDRGVFFLEIILLRNFAFFKHTQPVNAFTSDCYGMYHKSLSTGDDEIWVSTELGIYRTKNNGVSWEDTGLRTGGIPVFQFMNISNDNANPNVIAMTRKHIFRLLGNEPVFQEIANFEDQHGIFDNWKMEYFASRIYVSNGNGVYANTFDNLFTAGVIAAEFTKLLDKLDNNNNVVVAFGLDAVKSGEEDVELLFIGQENQLMMVDAANKVSSKVIFRNKELPTFFIDDVEQNIGYIYNAFNGVLSIREPQPVNTIVSAAKLPRKAYFAINGGWAQTNPDAEVFVYHDGFPKWLFFQLNQNAILGAIQIVEDNLNTLPVLDTFNSLHPESQQFLDATLSDINTLKVGGEEGVPLVNDDTIISFLDNYTRLLSLITEEIAAASELALPEIRSSGITREGSPATSKALALELVNDLLSENSVGINIDTFIGKVDFATALANATDPEERAKLTFDKYDRFNITTFNTNVKGTGEFTHREVENRFEDINSGLTSHLARASYTNFIKMGIFIEAQNRFVFDRFNVSNIQSRFYASYTNAWYDVLNSTLDYDTWLTITNNPEPNFANSIHIFGEDPYFGGKIWVATNNDIMQYDFNITGELEAEDIVRPGDGPEALFVWDIFANGGDIYVVAEEKEAKKGHIFKTDDFGVSWEELETINVPDQIHSFRIINGTFVVGTEEGIFYSDNNFGTWNSADVVLSNHLSDDSPALTAFRERIRNFGLDTFIMAESDRWFYTSGSGVEYFAIGRITNNGCTVVNKMVRFKSLTWIATDKGLYNDGNSLLSDSVQFGLETELEESLAQSSAVAINDIANGADALYTCGDNGKVYRFWDEGNGEGNEWKRYKIPTFDTVHRILLNESENRLIVFSYNKIKVLNITPTSGVFG